MQDRKKTKADQPTVSRDRQLWTEEELRVLVTYYGTEGAKGVFDRLEGGRSRQSIQLKAARLSLRSPVRWTPAEQKELVRMANAGMSPEEIAEKLVRSVSSATQKYRKLVLLQEQTSCVQVASRQRASRYTVDRVSREMTQAGSRYLSGKVVHLSSLVQGRCACGEVVTKTVENWFRTPGGCRDCRP